MGRSHLPSNTWLQGRLIANMNINNTCNAFWNGSTVNFYRSGGGCANTGEIAAMFDHEWGLGVDANDYEQRTSGNPHDYSWSNASCGGSVHCVGGVYSEAVWSLWKRQLPALYGMDNNTAAEIVTRMTYIAAGSTST